MQILRHLVEAKDCQIQCAKVMSDRNTVAAGMVPGVNNGISLS
jgi:hypothetical protein